MSEYRPFAFLGDGKKKFTQEQREAYLKQHGIPGEDYSRSAMYAEYCQHAREKGKNPDTQEQYETHLREVGYVLSGDYWLPPTPEEESRESARFVEALRRGEVKHSG